MPNNFVVAFGGTGARCIEALTYLAASGVIRSPLHILMIDPDGSNGNVFDALNQLQRYHAVQQHIGPGVSEECLFSTPLNPGVPDSSSFRWQYPNLDQSFKRVLEFDSRPREVRDLLALLYDQSDMELTFEQGYVGRAHVGALDLHQTLSRALRPPEGTGGERSSLQLFFNALREAAQSGGANLAVCGSVFGGTGASGLPALPPLVDDYLKEVCTNIRVGCVQVAPYFSFPAGSAGNPNSTLHPLATQAALYHYAFNTVGYDVIYLTGAPERPETNDQNKLGGGEQRNRAHYVELAAALAIAHFFAGSTPVGDTQVLASGSTAVSWTDLPSAEAGGRLQERMATLATAAVLHSRFLFTDLQERRHTESRWHAALQESLGRNRALGGGEDALKDLQEFCTRFLEWAAYVQREAPALFTIDPNASPSELLRSVLNDGKPGADAYDEIQKRLHRTESRLSNAVGWYLDALSQATMSFCADHYRHWWSHA